MPLLEHQCPCPSGPSSLSKMLAGWRTSDFSSGPSLFSAPFKIRSPACHPVPWWFCGALGWLAGFSLCAVSSFTHVLGSSLWPFLNSSGWAASLYTSPPSGSARPTAGHGYAAGPAPLRPHLNMTLGVQAAMHLPCCSRGSWRCPGS